VENEKSNFRKFGSFSNIDGSWCQRLQEFSQLGMPGHETLVSSHGMHTPDGSQWIPLKTMTRTLRIVKIWCGDEGALPPATPVNPYLGQNARKKWASFWKPSHIPSFRKPHFWVGNSPWGVLRSYMSHGGHSVAATP